MPRWGVAAAMAVGAGLVLLSLSLAWHPSNPSGPRFQPLTFRRGWVSAARFTSDGQTVVYSASWNGAPSELFSTRLGSPESVPLGYPHADLLAVSSTGELALLRSPGSLCFSSLWAGFGSWSASSRSWPASSTLALAPFSGGTPRELDDAGFGADYSPDGRSMAVARVTDTGTQLDYPLGTARAQDVWGTYPGWFMRSLTVARISPDGRRLAYFKGGTELVVAELGGASKTLASNLRPGGLAWSPDGSEVWFAGERTLRAVTVSGRQRVVYASADPVVLHDVTKDGRVLLTVIRMGKPMLFRGDKDAGERDLTWLDWSMPTGLSADGRLVVFWESEMGVGGVETVFVRDTGGAPPVKLGEGIDPCLSADGRLVAAVQRDQNEVVVYPVGPGVTRTVSVTGIQPRTACPLAGGKTICIFGSEPLRGMRIWLTDIGGAKPRAISPEGVRGVYPYVTADGQNAVARVGGAAWLYPLAGGQPRLLAGVPEDELIAALGADSRSAFVYRPGEMPLRVFRVDLQNGRRELSREIGSVDRAGMGIMGSPVFLTPDGESYIYSPTSVLSVLYLIEGLK